MDGSARKLIFISHATAENASADRIAAALEAAGFTAWVDHQGGIEPGTSDWDARLREIIKDCAAGLLVMSPHWMESRISRAECHLLQELGKPLYVAYLATCAPEQIWLTINMIQYADVRTDFDGGLARLARALSGERTADLPTPLAGLARLERTLGERAADGHPFYRDHPVVEGWRQE